MLRARLRDDRARRIGCVRRKRYEGDDRDDESRAYAYVGRRSPNLVVERRRRSDDSYTYGLDLLHPPKYHRLRLRGFRLYVELVLDVRVVNRVRLGNERVVRRFNYDSDRRRNLGTGRVERAAAFNGNVDRANRYGAPGSIRVPNAK